jgi:hypothetical protein
MSAGGEFILLGQTGALDQFVLLVFGGAPVPPIPPAPTTGTGSSGRGGSWGWIGRKRRPLSEVLKSLKRTLYREVRHRKRPARTKELQTQISEIERQIEIQLADLAVKIADDKAVALKRKRRREEEFLLFGL